MIAKKPMKIFSMLLAVLICVSMLPISALADGDAAKIGATGYATLQAAISAAQADDKVILLQNVTENVTISTEKVITLDLNGYTLTNAGSHTITNSGTLTIEDSSEAKKGTVDCVTHQMAALFNDQGGTVTLEGGTFERSKENGSSATDNGGNSYYTIVNRGVLMTINAGVTVLNSGAYSSMIETGFQTFAQHQSGHSPKTVINGGTFTGGLYNIKVDDYGIVTINGGTFSGASQAPVLNWNKLTINDGTFKSETFALANEYDNDTYNAGEATIIGGTFISTDSIIHIYYAGTPSGGSVRITGGDFTSGEIASGNVQNTPIKISGGSFTQDPRTYAGSDTAAVVIFDFDGGVDAKGYGYTLLSGIPGGALSAPTGITKTGYALTGWDVPDTTFGAADTVKTYTAQWALTHQVTITTYPKRAELTIKDSSGNVIEPNEDGTYDLADGDYTYEASMSGYENAPGSFTVENGELKDLGTITLTADVNQNAFTDVDWGEWYKNAVLYSVAGNLFSGTGDTTWEPDTALTRAMFVTVLGKYFGIEGDDSATCIFDDVDDGKWYTSFVQWASDEGLVEGIGDNKFDPNAPITRQEMAIIFWKYVNKTGADMTSDATMYNSFPDNGETASWAVTALTWATDRRIMNGDDQGRLLSTGTATRAQAAQVFMVIIENIL